MPILLTFILNWFVFFGGEIKTDLFSRGCGAFIVVYIDLQYYVKSEGTNEVKAMSKFFFKF